MILEKGIEYAEDRSTKLDRTARDYHYYLCWFKDLKEVRDMADLIIESSDNEQVKALMEKIKKHELWDSHGRDY